MTSEWITPGLVVAVGLGLWRLFHTEMQALRRDLGDRIDAVEQRLGDRIDRLNDCLDRHLEGHPHKRGIPLQNRPLLIATVVLLLVGARSEADDPLPTTFNYDPHIIGTWAGRDFALSSVLDAEITFYSDYDFVY